MATISLSGNALRKTDIEYHGKFRHTIGRIYRIDFMSRIDIFYTACHMETQTVAPTLPGLQGIKHCIQYLYSHPHKTIFFILLIIMMDKMLSDLHGVRIKLKTTLPTIVYNAINMRIMI